MSAEVVGLIRRLFCIILLPLWIVKYNWDLLLAHRTKVKLGAALRGVLQLNPTKLEDLKLRAHRDRQRVDSSLNWKKSWEAWGLK